MARVRTNVVRNLRTALFEQTIILHLGGSIPPSPRSIIPALYFEFEGFKYGNNTKMAIEN